MSNQIPTVAPLGLQGGGSHGAFTWGGLDRLLQEVAADRLRFAGISGTSAGAFNAALPVSGLVLSAMINSSSTWVSCPRTARRGAS